MSDFHVETTVTANKAHACCECSGKINAGDSYVRNAGAQDAQGFSYKTCAPCSEARDWLDKQLRSAGLLSSDEGLEFGALQAELTEFASESRFQDVASLRYLLGIAERRGGTPHSTLTAQPATVPDGYALVPARMHLDKDVIELINGHCGDGADGSFGDYADGILWVGHVENDDGSKTYGLHLATADYPEEGSSTLVEFDPSLQSDCNDCHGTGFTVSIIGEEMRCPCGAPINIAKPRGAASESGEVPHG
ncbi:hypothetical protein FQZ97_739060 [compost metagenome]